MLSSTLPLRAPGATRSRPGLAALALAALVSLAAFTRDGVAAEREPVRRSPSADALAAAAQGEARVIVKFKSDSTMMRALSAASGAQAEPQQAKALSSRLGLALRDGRGLGPRSQLVFASGLSSADLAARLSKQSDVEYAVVDGRQRALAAPNDPRYPYGQLTTPIAGQWYLRAPDATIVSAINAEGAWDVTTGSASVVVAVLDTGIRPEHPDLQAKLLQGYDFIHDIGTANDGDARDTDPSDPGDYVTSADVSGASAVAGCTSSDIGPSSWHGTQTAGLIGAATNNGVGMASVGRDISLLPLRVLGKCGGYDSDIQDAMRWAAGLAVTGVPTNTHPAKVVNLSLGSAGSCSQAYQDVVNQLTAAGVVVVAAAGNDGLAVGTPANCNGVLAVAAVRHSGTKVGFSDLGPQIALSAPGGNCVNTTGTCLYPLLTTSNSGPTTPNTTAAGSIYTDGDNHISVGTSFSAPLVAGTAALMFSVNPALTPAQIKAKLQQTARAFPSTGAGAGVSACTAPTSTAQDSECYCTTSTCGAGMLDASAAVVASILNPVITASATTVTTGTAVTLDGSSSQAFAGASIVGYQWAITGGANLGGLSSTNAATTTLSTIGTGTVTVTLTVTDNAGRQASTSSAITLTSAATSNSSGGGGGAFDPLWLLGVIGATIVLALPVRQRVAVRRARR